MVQIGSNRGWIPKASAHVPMTRADACGKDPSLVLGQEACGDGPGPPLMPRALHTQGRAHLADAANGCGACWRRTPGGPWRRSTRMFETHLASTVAWYKSKNHPHHYSSSSLMGCSSHFSHLVSFVRWDNGTTLSTNSRSEPPRDQHTTPIITHETPPEMAVILCRMYRLLCAHIQYCSRLSAIEPAT